MFGMAMDAGTAMAGEQVKTICIGHFLVDVPRDADARATGSYWGVRVEPLGHQEFVAVEEELKGKAEDLERQGMRRTAWGDAFDRRAGRDPERHYAPTRLIALESDRANEQVVLGYHGDDSGGGIVAEVHRVLDGRRYRFSVANAGADKYPVARDRVVGAAGRYSPLQRGEIPEEPGFCIGDGVFREDGPRDVGGDGTSVVRFSQYPNVVFSIDVSGLLERPNESLLEERISADFGLLARLSSNVKTLQRGKARYAEQAGYEVGISAPNEDEPGTRMQKFFFGTEGKVRDARHPVLEVQLITGESGPSPLSDEEASVLWKQLVRSLRLRSGSL